MHYQNIDGDILTKRVNIAKCYDTEKGKGYRYYGYCGSRFGEKARVWDRAVELKLDCEDDHNLMYTTMKVK